MRALILTLVVVLGLISLWAHLGPKVVPAPAPLRVQFGFPVTSLDPLIYDDWSAVFVGNHIYHRFIAEPERAIAQGIAGNLKMRCDGIESVQMNCPRIRVSFSIEPFKDCMGRTYSVDDIKKEFSMIIDEKTWILPDHELCHEPGADVCLTATNVPEIARRLKNLYMRFGWSKASASDGMFGSGPYCLKVTRKKNETIYGGELQLQASQVGGAHLPQKIEFNQSIDPAEPFDVALYGTSALLRGNRRNIPTQTPLGYFVVSNSKLRSQLLPWNTVQVRDIIKKHLDRHELTYAQRSALDDLLPKGGAVEGGLRKRVGNLRERERVLSLPDYLPDCESLKSALNEHWSQAKSSALAECANTSALAEQIVKHGKSDWGGFLTPISPGVPGKNSIAYQYFSPESRESFTGPAKNAAELFYLTGIGQSFTTLDGVNLCRLKANPLGLGDVFVSDFVRCN